MFSLPYQHEMILFISVFTFMLCEKDGEDPDPVTSVGVASKMSFINLNII